MLKLLYKRILGKLDLNPAQLQELFDKLNVDHVCVGKFIDGARMCPNTLALSIKEETERFSDNKKVVGLFNKYSISKFELSILFYVLFDLPALLSKKAKKRCLLTLKEGVTELANSS